MELGAVAGQDVVAEVCGGVPPDGVNMVDVALSVVVLGKQARCLQPVVVRLSALDAASPGEVDRVQFVAGELFGLPLGEFVRDSADEDVEDGPEELTLTGCQCRCSNTPGRGGQANGAGMFG